MADWQYQTCPPVWLGAANGGNRLTETTVVPVAELTVIAAMDGLVDQVVFACSDLAEVVG